MLYLHKTLMRLALKLFRGEPAISGFDWNFSAIHTSSPPFSRLDALLTLAFTSAPDLKSLTSPVRTTRRTVLQKVRSPSYKEVPQLVDTGFQVLFHSPPGVLFTFPSQYYALSVTKKYLALRGGPRSFRQGFSCLVLLWILLGDLGFRIRGFHSLRPDFPVRSPILRLPQRSPNPAMHASRFGLFPFRSPLLWKSINFLSLPPGT